MRRRMSKIQSYRDLIAWQKAMDLADFIYTVTEPFPKREWFGLAYQMRKSAVSVPSNIAEGNRRRIPSYVHHLEISLGSHGELDTQCELATRRKLINAMHHRQIESLLGDVGRLTHGLLRSIDPSATSALIPDPYNLPDP
jgi:four helix bundle protein